MAAEIERKFLVLGDDYKKMAVGLKCRQGYIHSGSGRTVRVRTMNDRAFLTIKGAGSGISRLEYEYDIPMKDASEMLELLCEKPLIEKVRYKVPFAGFTWEVDEFFGENLGLVLAEIELEHEAQSFQKPAWIGAEVSGEARYYNASLVRMPYSSWQVKTTG